MTVAASAGEGTNPWWLADHADVTIPSVVGSLTFQIHVARTPGVSFTGAWSTLPGGSQVAETDTANEVVCTFVSPPGRLAPGTYSFTCGINMSSPHSMTLDTWVLNTTAPTVTANGMMGTAAPGESPLNPWRLNGFGLPQSS
jgi:hypothetical protein